MDILLAIAIMALGAIVLSGRCASAARTIQGECSYTPSSQCTASSSAATLS